MALNTDAGHDVMYINISNSYSCSHSLSVYYNYYHVFNVKAPGTARNDGSVYSVNSSLTSYIFTQWQFY